MARPPVKQALVVGWLSERRRATAREVAHGLQMSIGDASLQLHRLQQSGQVATVDRVRVEHAKRPVAVYGPASTSMQARGSAIFSDDWLRSS